MLSALLALLGPEQASLAADKCIIATTVSKQYMHVSTASLRKAEFQVSNKKLKFNFTYVDLLCSHAHPAISQQKQNITVLRDEMAQHSILQSS